MERQKQINMEHLYRLAQAGKPAEEIMRELDITDMAAMKNALTQLMREKGEEFQVPGLIGSASINPRYTDNGIRISPEMLDGTGFKAGDQFRLAVSGNKIVLEREE